MTSEGKVGLKRALFWCVIAIVSVLLLLWLTKTVGLGLGLLLVVVLLAGYAIFLIGMPLFFWIIGEAGYRTFLKPYVRVWRIRRIRNRRLWDEAAARHRSDSL
jgi:hypothetical protein